jgi:hypothetical protein
LPTPRTSRSNAKKMAQSAWERARKSPSGLGIRLGGPPGQLYVIFSLVKSARSTVDQILSFGFARVQKGRKASIPLALWEQKRSRASRLSTGSLRASGSVCFGKLESLDYSIFNKVNNVFSTKSKPWKCQCCRLFSFVPKTLFPKGESTTLNTSATARGKLFRDRGGGWGSAELIYKSSTFWTIFWSTIELRCLFPELPKPKLTNVKMFFSCVQKHGLWLST